MLRALVTQQSSCRIEAARRVAARHIGDRSITTRFSTRASHRSVSVTTMSLEIYQFNALSDNYGYLLHDKSTGATAAVDTPEAAAIERALSEKGWKLTHILNTHHHHDHTGGNTELKKKFNCQVVGPRADADRIPAIDHPVAEWETVKIGNCEATVFDTPGHTRGHCVYYFKDRRGREAPNGGALFCGDTLFSMGCGRLFEGTPAQMWSSLSKLMTLPDETKVYCAHEYTQSNARFALTVEPNNAALKARAAEVAALREKGQPTIPSTMAVEKATNPFLRPDSADLQAALGLSGASLVEVFAETRKRKDNF